MAIEYLKEVVNCIGVNHLEPLSGEAMLLASLSNLKCALENDALEKSVALAFLIGAHDRIVDFLEERNLKEVPDLTISTVNNLFVEEFQFTRNKFGFLNRKHALLSPKSDDLHCNVVSYQPFSILKYWVDNSTDEGSTIKARLEAPSPSKIDVIRIINFIREEKNCLPDAAVGAPNRPLWLTLKRGRVAEIVDGLNEGALLESLSDISTEFRDSLGLWKNDSEHAIIVVSNFSIGEATKKTREKFAAPTVLDSGGYERFRHWPPTKKISVLDPEYGRTYELNPKDRSEKFPNNGVPEIITNQIPLDRIEVIEYVGRSGPVPRGKDARSAHISFANEVTNGTNLSEVIDSLVDLIGVTNAT